MYWTFYKTNVIIFLALIVFAQSCATTADDDEMVFGCFIKNESSSICTILMASEGRFEPADSLDVLPNETLRFGFYRALSYSHYGCEPRKIVFRFENGKGYECFTAPSSFGNISELCFLNDKDPFFPRRLPNEGDGSLTIVTQEDYENAYHL